MKARIPLPSPETMSSDQKAVYDKVVSGPRGRVVGPLRAALHNPALADRWQAFGQVLRFETSLPVHLNELAILVTGRHWNSELEWTIHVAAARKAGLDDAIIDAIRDGRAPVFTEPAAREIYAFSRELLMDGQVSQAAYTAVLDRWGPVGAVELTALVGYYTMVAMTLNAHQIPLPEDIAADLNTAAQTQTPVPPAGGGDVA